MQRFCMFGLFGTNFEGSSATANPNILIFMTEDMSPRTGFAGDKLDVTPNLNAFAKRAVTLTNVYSVYGVCSPSRSSFATGRYPFSYGAHNMRSDSFVTLPEGSPYLTVPTPDVKAFSETLRQNGYWTFATAKCDLQFSDYNCNTAPLSMWSKLVNNMKSGLWRLQPDWDSRPWMGMIDDQSTHESKIFNGKNPEVLNRSQTVERVEVPAYLKDTKLMRNDIASQYNSIANMDGHFGGVMDRLEEDKLLDDTIVIWMSDHGDGLPRGKRDVYDTGIHAPCIMWIPEKFQPDWWPAPGAELDRMVSFIDFAPSLLDLVGVPVPKTIHGKSMFGSPEKTRGQYVFGAKDRMDEAYDRVRYVRRMDGFKFIRNYMPELPAGGRVSYRFQQQGASELRDLFNAGKLNEVQSKWFSPRQTEEFYDLSADPLEINDLANTDSPTYVDIMAELRSALDEELASVIDLGATNETVIAERFWPGGVQPVTPDPVVQIDSQLLTLTEQAEGSSLMYQLKGCGQDDEWYVYGDQPVTMGKCTSVKARAQYYGWKVSGTVAKSAGALVV